MTAVRVAAALGVAAACLVPASARADVVLVERDHGSFTLGGYVRTTSAAQAWQHTGWLDDLELDPLVGQNTGVARLEWTGTIADRLTLDLHQRVLWRVTGGELQDLGGSVFGVGVTAAPETTVSLRTVLLSHGSTVAEHDIDRLSARVYFDHADLYVGRQAIAWGTSLLFPVADVWTRFAPFELDTAERRGVDAVRVIWGPSLDSELEFVVVDRGAPEDLGGGVRATFYRQRSDVFVAAAKTYDEVFVAGGWVRDLEWATLRGEVMVPLDTDDEGAASLGLPRATAGIDRLAGDYYLVAEYHYNGAGAADAADYVEHATSEDVYARGEVYLVGRHYVGATVAYNPTEVVTLGAGGFLNVLDPSAVLMPTFVWQLAQDVELGAGAFLPVGERATLLPTPALGSEFGAAPYYVYAQLAAYY